MRGDLFNYLLADESMTHRLLLLVSIFMYYGRGQCFLLPGAWWQSSPVEK